MKRRVRRIVNFFAFNLLFFALYLNFIHKDKSGVEVQSAQVNTATVNHVSGTTLVENPEKYLGNKPATQVAQPEVKAEKNDAIKNSIN